MVVAPRALHNMANGSRIILDGAHGRAIVHPTEAEWVDYTRKRERMGRRLVSRIKRLTVIPP